MEINKNCHAYHLAFRVPDGESSRLDEFFEAHEKFMRETHFVDGEMSPVSWSTRSQSVLS